MSSIVNLRSFFQTTAMLFVLVPAVALGGGQAVMVLDDEPTKITWQGKGMVRIDESADDEYLVVRDNTPYIVTEENGQPLVIDLTGMADFLAEFGGQPKRNPYNWGKMDTFNSTTTQEVVAGIQGNVYKVTFKQDNGQTLHMDAVLTDDSQVVELLQRYAATLKNAFDINAIQELLSNLPKDQQGVLRLGRSMKLQSISNDEPSDELFALPAKPVSFGDLMQK